MINSADMPELFKPLYYTMYIKPVDWKIKHHTCWNEIQECHFIY